MIGKLDDTVTLLARDTTPDGGGGFDSDWREIARVPAAVEHRPSTRDRSGLRERGIYRKRITIRARDGLTHDTRLMLDGIAYRLRSIRLTGAQDQFHLLDAEEI